MYKLDSSKLSVTDVFGSNLPYTMIIAVVSNDYLNRDAFIPPTYVKWHGITEVIVKVNNRPICYLINNLKDAYFHTRRALHLDDDKQMYCTYDDYENGNVFLVYKLYPMEDSNIRVLPKEPKRNVDIEMQFTQDEDKTIYIMNQAVMYSFLQTCFKNTAY